MRSQPQETSLTQAQTRCQPTRRQPNGFVRALGGLMLMFVLLAGCGGGGGSSSSNAVAATPPPAAPSPPQPAGVVATTAFKSTSPFADNLQRCTYLGTNTQTCTLNELPFLGQRASNPTIEDVLDHTLVSHDWMGENFRTLLGLLPSDLLELFRSVTAVVIASDVRPAFYDPNTGAIYLDPDFLWSTEAERSTVSTAPDFRSNFGDALGVSLPWRYVKDNQNFGIRVNPDGSRDLNEVVVVMGFLLYHELAHAIDFMHPSRMPGLNSNLTAASYLTSGLDYLSNSFRTNHPLTSTLMDQLATVSFRGEDATAAQQALTEADIINEFPPDAAIQYYAYSSTFEDFATLFETTMMSFHFGYEKDTAITNNAPSSANAIVAWGQRGRLGSQLLNQRTRSVIASIGLSNQTAVADHVNALPLPTQMREGESWSANISLSAPTASSLATNKTLNTNREANGEVAAGAQIDYFFDRVSIK